MAAFAKWAEHERVRLV